MDVERYLASTRYTSRGLAYTKKCMKAGLHTELFTLRYNYSIPEVNPFVFPSRWVWENFNDSLIYSLNGEINYNPRYFAAFQERAKSRGFKNPDVLGVLRPLFQYQYHCMEFDKFVGRHFLQPAKTTALTPKKLFRDGAMTFGPSDELVKTLFHSRTLTKLDLSKNLWDFLVNEMCSNSRMKRSDIPPIHGGLLKDVSWENSVCALEDILRGDVKADGVYAEKIESYFQNSYRNASRMMSFRKMMRDFMKSEYFDHERHIANQPGELVYFTYSTMWFRDTTSDDVDYMPGVPVTSVFIDVSDVGSLDFQAAVSGISGYVFPRNKIHSDWANAYFGPGHIVYGCPMMSFDGTMWYSVDQVVSLTNPPGNLVWHDPVVDDEYPAGVCDVMGIKVPNLWMTRSDLYRNFPERKSKSTSGSEEVNAVKNILRNSYRAGADGIGTSLVRNADFMVATRRGLKVRDFNTAVKSLIPSSVTYIH